MAKTTIEWTEFTWNPFVGCEIVSAGCTNCYAMRMAHRLEGMGVASYQGTTLSSKKGPVWTGKVNRSSETLVRKPLTLPGSQLVFVNSMSDFWNLEAKDEWRAEALLIMWQTPWHEYQVLTKRPQNITPILERMDAKLPPNLWLGATVEDHRVTDRLKMLREVEAEIRFISVEPMTAKLGKVDLTGIHWVILGGESGPHARPMQIEWAREVRDQCIEQKVPLFFKQWGQPRNNPLFQNGGELAVKQQDPIGKGGQILDGKKWLQFPRLPGEQKQLL